MISFESSFIWASMFWGSVASGYCLYGWKQRAPLPLAGGAAMMIASFFLPALAMSLVCLTLIGVVYWLVRQGR